MTETELLQKLQRFCAYQERSPRQLEQKMYALGVRSEQKDGLLAQLMEDNFFDEYRFAEHFAQSKLNQKFWAPYRIERELLQHGIPSVTVNRIVQGIDPALVERNGRYLINRWGGSKSLSQITSALQRRGYSFDQIQALINKEE